VVPGFIVATTLPDWRTLGRYDALLLTVSLCGLGFVPFTLVREFLAIFRDRRRRDPGKASGRRTRKRRQSGDRNEEA
jgi:hypothetical protein